MFKVNHVSHKYGTDWWSVTHQARHDIGLDGRFISLEEARKRINEYNQRMVERGHGAETMTIMHNELERWFNNDGVLLRETRLKTAIELYGNGVQIPLVEDEHG